MKKMKERVRKKEFPYINDNLYNENQSPGKGPESMLSPKRLEKEEKKKSTIQRKVVEEIIKIITKTRDPYSSTKFVNESSEEGILPEKELDDSALK